MIGFLSIDTDFNTETKTLIRDNVVEEDKNHKKEVSFNKSELLYTQVKGAHAAFTKLKNTVFDWMPPNNEHVKNDDEWCWAA